jgi:hypothetical protein
MKPIATPILLLMLAAAPAFALEPADATRLDAVAERGRHGMPFSLEKTTHVFTQTDTGGVQKVIAKDPKDAEQIRLIREHLRELAGEFARGDFSRPALIHGEAMPGLKEMKAAAGRIRYDYRDLPDGGQVDYVSQDPALIGAIHRYFDAQLRDHARHAVPRHGHHGRHGR